MKPYILEMNAFGPFSSKQIIDFSKLNGQNIFLITGPTGAGKTTIFDAICFALYGDASGESRQNDSLKSQHADINEKCYVSFSFFAKGDVYKIVRYPKQEKLGRNGIIRMINSSAEFTLPDGEILTNLSEVNKNIEELIGLNKEQFKKVVMLPQGEFRKLLEDKSDTKQEILRKIFSTSIYDEITEKLKEKAKQSKALIEGIFADNKASIRNVSADDDSDLAQAIAIEYPDFQLIKKLLGEEIQKDEENSLEIKQQAEKLLKQLNEINLSYAKQINDKFDELEKQNTKYKELDSKKQDFEKKRELISKLKICKEAVNIEDIVKKLNSEICEIKTKIAETKKEQSSAQQALEVVREQEKSIPKYQSQLEENIKQATLTSEMIEKVLARNKIKQDIINTNEQIFIAKEKIVFFDECIVYCEMLDTIEEKMCTIKSLKLLSDSLSAFKKQYLDFLIADKTLKNAMDLYYSYTVANLANELEENKPCPVCGSNIHPKPASFDGEKTFSKEEISRLEDERDSSREQLNRYEGECRSTIAKINTTSNLTIDEDKVFSDNDYLKQIIVGYENEFSGLKDSLDNKRSMLVKSDYYDEEYFSINTVKAVREKTISEEIAFNEKRGLLSEQLEKNKDLPTDIEYLKNQQFGLQEQQKKLRDNISDIQKNLSEAISCVERVSEKLQQQNEFLTRKNDDLKSANQELELFVAKNCPDNSDEIFGLRDSLNKLDNISQEVIDYDNSVSVCKAVLDKLNKELVNEKPYDIENLEKNYNELSVAYKDKNDEYVELAATLVQNKLAYNTLTENLEKSGQLEEQSRQIEYISQLARGDNSQKISFERFVLTAYYEEVIKAANLRLSGLTGERYTLHRKLEKEKNGRSSGLELAVFDAHTGKSRDVTTLSGGESFKAALSLALGLADTIGSHVGGVGVDTIFIDEGFGSLDEESLDSAISCLTELQTKGRLVGIISHVAQLKEKISSKLNVSPTKSGSVASFNIK